MSISTHTQRNKLMHLENTLIMYRIYNAKTLENSVKTVHALHSRQTLYEVLFTGQTSAAYKAYSQMHGAHGIQHYTVYSILYLRMINILKFIMNSFHNYKYTLNQLEFYSKVIYLFCL